MLPTADEAMRELMLAEKVNPGPWVKHSINTGIAAKSIAERLPSLDPEKAYILGLLHDIGRRVGIVDLPTHVCEGYRFCINRGWEAVFAIMEAFERDMGCPVYDVLPDIGRTTLLNPKPWRPGGQQRTVG